MGRAAILTVAIALVVASPAAAADVWVTVVPTEDYTYTYVDVHGAPGEANAVTVTGSHGSVVVHDAGAPLNATRGCRLLDPHRAECQSSNAPPLGYARLFGEDGDDELVDAAPGIYTTFHGGPGDDVLRGDDDPQDFHGGDGADQAIAGAGSDRLHGGPGADVLRAGAGFDRVYGDPPGRDAWPDVLDGGSDIDTVSYEGREGGVQIDLASAAPQGGPGEGDVLAGFERAEGGAGSDVILGDDGPNLLKSGLGGPGDVLDGRGGDDRLHGSSGDDVLNGGLGADGLDGGGGSDTYDGGPGGDGLVLDLGWQDPLDKARARVTCGSGRDNAYTPDWRVVVPRDCEEIEFQGIELRIRRATARRLALTFVDPAPFRCVAVSVAQPGATDRPLAWRAVRIGEASRLRPVLRWRRPVAGRVIVRLRGTDACRPHRGRRIGAFALRLSS